MKSIFLPIVVSVLLVTLGLGQTSAPSSNSGQVSVKGCLGGANGNYTLVEDGTTKTFTITSSTVDLTPHLGHDVELTGPAATVAASSGSSDNGVVVTGMNMISDHCATAIAGTTATVAETAPTATASTPAVAATTSTAAASAPADTTPAASASTPAAADTTPTATASTPAVAATTPTASVSTPAVADTTPAPNASTPAAADPTPTATASTPAAAANTPTATASTPTVADTTPAATARTPADAPSAPMMASASAPESSQTRRLPDTATQLPLLGLLGLGLLATALLSRRSRTN
jgi:hypothetical protein